jgi:hypothetical protein
MILPLLFILALMINQLPRSEAGANLNEDPRVKCPGASRSLLGDPDFDWQFESEPQVCSLSSTSEPMTAEPYLACTEWPNHPSSAW